MASTGKPDFALKKVPPSFLKVFKLGPQTKRRIVPKTDRIRRMLGSQSFKKTGKGEYRVVMEGKGKLITSASKWLVPQFNWSKTAGLVVNFYYKGAIIGEFCATAEEGILDVYHRKVEPEYRGYNLGRVGLMLLEQKAKEREVQRIRIHTNRPSELRTALLLHYNLNAESETRLKEALGIKKGQKVQAKKAIELLKQLEEKGDERFPAPFFVQKQLKQEE